MRRWLLVALSLACSTSCGDSITNAESLQGTWTLRDFAGIRVPGILHQDASFTQEVLSGSITFDADRYEVRVTYRETVTGLATTTTNVGSGTYTVEGRRVSGQGTAGVLPNAYRTIPPVDVTMVVEGNSLSYVEVGPTPLVFVR
jgi:hypothetical protein